jgi:hypothetical protein
MVHLFKKKNKDEDFKKLKQDKKDKEDIENQTQKSTEKDVFKELQDQLP